MREAMTVEQALHILESKTGYTVVAEDCDASAVIEAISIVCEMLRRDTFSEHLYTLKRKRGDAQ